MDDQLEAVKAQRRIEAEAEMKERAKHTFLSNPAATEQDFEKAWPEMRLALLSAETLRAEAERRAADSNFYKWQL
jgi:hypothetical protein